MLQAEGTACSKTRGESKKAKSLYKARLDALKALLCWCTGCKGGGVIHWKIKLVSEGGRSQIVKGVIHLAKEFRLIIRGVVNYSGILSWGLWCAQICIFERWLYLQCEEWIGEGKAGHRETSLFIFAGFVAMPFWRVMVEGFACCSSLVGWKIHLNDYAEEKHGNTFID